MKVWMYQNVEWKPIPNSKLETRAIVGLSYQGNVKVHKGVLLSLMYSNSISENRVFTVVIKSI